MMEKVKKRQASELNDSSSSKKAKLTVPDAVVDNEKPNESLTKPECSENAVLVASHYNSVEEELSIRHRSRIFYMRNFNNWIKSILINNYVNKIKDNKHGYPLNVLDMCCGKGGDLLKWKNANIRHLICVDLAELSMQQCKDRYNDMARNNSRGLFSVEFITADCTKIRLREKFKDPSIPLDLVSCQFAFHYCFESLAQAECMIKNASECLKPGGYFIGTIPDSYDLVSRWQNCDGNSFGNEFYNVEFTCDKSHPPLFGAKYNFQLDNCVNCPEFLVYLPLLCKIALKFNLELVLFEKFGPFYERMKNHHNHNWLLGKLQALEAYPSRQDSLSGKAEDYQHAKNYIEKTPNTHQIGTLSQSEWDICSLYAVFAFQKMIPAQQTTNKEL